MRFGAIFPGQGVQYPGMGADFAAQFRAAREVFEEADEVLGCKLSEAELFKTEWSQPAIFVVSMAIYAVIKECFPEIEMSLAAGLSLGEYSALVASGRIPF